MSTPPNDNSPQWGSPDAQGGQPGPGGAGPYGAAEPAGGQVSKFGTTGYDPGAQYNAPMEEPRQYSLLKTLTLAGLGLYVLSQLIGLVPLLGEEGRQAMEESLAAMGQPVSEELLDGAIAFGIGFVAVLTLIALGLYLLVYFGLKKVRNWARVTGLVFAIIGLVFTVGGFALDTSMLTTAFGLISLAVSVAWAAVTVYWLVLAFSTPVRDYMDQYRI